MKIGGKMRIENGKLEVEDESGINKSLVLN